jgi:protein TonB
MPRPHAGTLMNFSAPPPPVKRSSWPLITAAIALLVLVAGGVGVWVYRSSSTTEIAGRQPLPTTEPTRQPSQPTQPPPSDETRPNKVALGRPPQPRTPLKQTAETKSEPIAEKRPSSPPPVQPAEQSHPIEPVSKEPAAPAKSPEKGPNTVPGGVPGGLRVPSTTEPIAAPPPPPPKPSERPQTPQRIRVGGAVEAANIIRAPRPVYPQLAKQARIQGTVRFTAIIGKDGTVQNLELVSGHPLLVSAAQEAVKQWVYKPTTLNGEPVEVITQIDVNFTLSQ